MWFELWMHASFFKTLTKNEKRLKTQESNFSNFQIQGWLFNRSLQSCPLGTVGAKSRKVSRLLKLRGLWCQFTSKKSLSNWFFDRRQYLSIIKAATNFLQEKTFLFFNRSFYKMISKKFHFQKNLFFKHEKATTAISISMIF